MCNRLFYMLCFTAALKIKLFIHGRSLIFKATILLILIFMYTAAQWVGGYYEYLSSSHSPVQQHSNMSPNHGSIVHTLLCSTTCTWSKENACAYLTLVWGSLSARKPVSMRVWASTRRWCMLELLPWCHTVHSYHWRSEPENLQVERHKKNNVYNYV